MNTWIRPGLLMVWMLSSIHLIAQIPNRTNTDPGTLIAEESNSCGSAQVLEEQLKRSPIATARYYSQEWSVLNEGSQYLSNSRSSGLTIPVVVHVVHSNGMGFTSPSQVNNAIQQLNDAFGNLGAYAQSGGTNAGIEFCLAKRDPQGNPTTGINIVQSPYTNLVRETQDSLLKSFVNWPSEAYLNIWVVHSLTSSTLGPGIIGYASMPFMHGEVEDGIVIEAANFGTTNDDTKVLVHEAGHYLGLFHTFHGGCDNSDCQSAGDKVCDTPPDASTANAVGYVNSCTTDEDDTSINNPYRSVSFGGLGDQPDQIENYMDYGDLRVLSVFTQGQVDRMSVHLQNFRASLLDPLTCTSPCTTAVAASYTTPSTTYTIGDTLWLTNTSTGASLYSWSLDGNPFSTLANPYIVLNSVGQFEIALEADNGQLGCSDIYTQQIVVECDVQASFTGASTTAFPGQELSFINSNPNGNGQTWLLDGVPIDTAGTFTDTFNQAGGYTLQMVSHSNLCNDSSSITYLEIGSCGMEVQSINWVFGDSSAMNFKDDFPVVSASSGMFSDEGCTSISDNEGNLLFYSNGVTVWNRDHEIMPNGNFLLGNRSSSQGVVAVPYPGQSGKYILFTTDAIEWTFFNGLRYNVIDMSLDSGRGDITAQKNVWMAPMSSEMIAAVQHENGEDFWLVTHEAFSSKFMIYEVTAAGVNTTPQIFTAGPNIALPTGALKISPNRKKLAITCNAPSARCLLVMDFNPGTGVLTNPIEIMHPNNTQIYGAEFSAENSKVYFTTLDQLWQVDLSLGSQQAIINSKTLISSGPTIRLLGMQRALNGKIYIASGFFSKLHEIGFPDAAGAACGFQWEALDMNSRNSRWGLPNFPVGIPNELQPVKISGIDTLCSKEISTYSVTRFNNTDVIEWEVLGQGQMMSNPSDSVVEVMALQTGNLQLVCSRTTNCGISRDTMDIFGLPSPLLDLGEDKSICQGESYMISSPTTVGQSWLWSDNSSGPTITATQPGIYWARASSSDGCSTRDSIEIDWVQTSQVGFDLGPDTTICEGKVVFLNPQLGTGVTYRWQDGSNLDSYSASTAGTYYVKVTNECGVTNQDTIEISTSASPFFTLGPDRDICPGDTIELVAGADYAYYQWQDDSDNNTFQATQPGLYWLEVTSLTGCSSRDSIQLTTCPVTSIEDGSISSFSVYPNPTSGPLQIQFSEGSLDPLEVRVFNALGQEVLTKVVNENEVNVQLDLSHLESGTYYLVIQDPKGNVRTSRIMLAN